MTESRAPRLMFIAGENSGDQHGARLIYELKKILPDVECFGFGGERMESAGMRLDENLAQKLPIIGFTQVARNYPKLRALFARAVGFLRNEKPDALVLIDYPGFNLRLSAQAKALGIPVIYYISPQLWAWHGNRLKIIAQNVAKMLVILPFEQQLFHSARVSVAYVGHPLMDDEERVRPRADIRRELGVADNQRLIGLIPGSRNGEVIRHLPILLDAAELIHGECGNCIFVVPRASTISRDLLDKYIARHPGLPLKVVEQDLKSVRAAMDFAVCKSGTSTLELALLAVPMIIIYKVSLPTYILAKAVLKIPWIGLVNIVANEEVAPELKQFNCTPEKIAQTTLSFLNDPKKLETQKEQLAQVRAKIGRTGASRRAAEEIAHVLADNRTGA